MKNLIIIYLFLLTPLFVLAEEGGFLVPCIGSDCDFNAFIQLGQNILNFLVMISIPLSAIAFAWAGFLYLSSGGSPDKIKKAHDIFTKVAIGLILVLGAWLIVNLIMVALTGEGISGIFSR